MILFVLLVTLFSSAPDIFREVILIPALMQPRWINVEYNNPKCPTLEKNESVLVLPIPESGYVCMSNSGPEDLFQRSYFLMGLGGERTPLTPREQIFQEAVLSKDEPSLDEGFPVCKVSLHQFFYGKKGDLKESNPIFFDEAFLKIHPECRRTGHSVKKGN